MSTRRFLLLAILVLGFLVQGVSVQSQSCNTLDCQAAGAMICPDGSFDIGDLIHVVWGIAQPTGNDWIRMYRIGAPDSDYVDQQQATPTVDGDGKGGVVYFKATTPGQYTFRFFRDGVLYMNCAVVTTVTGQVAQATKVPFGGGPLAQPTVVQGGGPPWATAQQSDVEGGVNLSIVCTDLGFPYVTNINNTADGWRCKDGAGNLSFLDWDSICRRVWGQDRHGVKVSDDQGGMRCLTGSQSVPTPISQPTQQPTAARQLDCNGLSWKFNLGEVVTVTSAGDGHNVRAGFSVSEPIRGTVHAGQQLILISGPQCADGYRWYQVKIDDSNTWWMADTDGSNQFFTDGNVAPPPSNPQPSGNGNCGAKPSQLHAGDIAIVTNYDPYPVRIRVQPSINATQIGQINPLQTLSIISADPNNPVCNDGYTWVEVGYNEVDGWSAEVGQDGKYNLVPNGQPVSQPTIAPIVPTPQPQPTQVPVQQPQNPTGNSDGNTQGSQSGNTSNGNSPQSSEGKGLDLYDYCLALRYTGLKLISNDVDGWRCVTNYGDLRVINLSDVCTWQYPGQTWIPLFTSVNDPNSWKCYPLGGGLPQGQNIWSNLENVVLELQLHGDQIERILTLITQAANAFQCSGDVLVIAQNAVTAASAAAQGSKPNFVIPPDSSENCGGSLKDVLGIVLAQYPDLGAAIEGLGF